MSKKTGNVPGLVKRKSQFVKRLIVGFCVVLVISIAAFFLLHFINLYRHSKTSIAYLYEKWDEQDYQTVYDNSAQILAEKPFHNTALTLHGYAAFYLFLAEIDTSQAQSYLDESIRTLRVALLNATPKSLPQLEYMLGKAYFHKNSTASYIYYADVAIHYLLLAQKDGYKSNDIPLLLGLSYASLGMTTESISAFSGALLIKPSDNLLLSIAEQYYKAEQYVAAAQYLYRISVECKDEKILMKCHILLGSIYTYQGKYEDAELEFQRILEKNENSADAYYGLGVIYEKQGDVIKARSEWRKALRIQANHADALKKLAEYK